MATTVKEAQDEVHSITMVVKRNVHFMLDSSTNRRRKNEGENIFGFP